MVVIIGIHRKDRSQRNSRKINIDTTTIITTSTIKKHCIIRILRILLHILMKRTVFFVCTTFFLSPEKKPRTNQVI